MSYLHPYLAGKAPGTPKAGQTSCLNSDIAARLGGPRPGAPPLRVCDAGHGLLDERLLEDIIPSTALDDTFASFDEHCATLHALLRGAAAVTGWGALCARHAGSLRLSIHSDNILTCAGLLDAVAQQACEDGAAVEFVCFTALASIVERILGDVYIREVADRTASPPESIEVPHLLRDLIVKLEVIEGAGRGLHHWTRVLLGSKCSMNLRNLAWHGLLHTAELPAGSPQFTLLLTLSLLRRLEGRCGLQGATDEITPSWVRKSTPLDCHSLPRIPSDDASQGAAWAGGAPFNRECALVARRLSAQGHTLLAACALLPLIEQSLRRFYIIANNLPEYYFCAQHQSKWKNLNDILGYYLEPFAANCTDGCESDDFDTALAARKNGPSGPPEAACGEGVFLNRLWEWIGVELWAVCGELFVHGKGPRVRDRLSHAEVSQSDLGPGLVEVLFALLTSLSAAQARPERRAPEARVSLPLSLAHHPRAALFRNLARVHSEWWRMLRLLIRADDKGPPRGALSLVDGREAFMLCGELSDYALPVRDTPETNVVVEFLGNGKTSIVPRPIGGQPSGDFDAVMARTAKAARVCDAAVREGVVRALLRLGDGGAVFLPEPRELTDPSEVVRVLRDRADLNGAVLTEIWPTSPTSNERVPAPLTIEQRQEALARCLELCSELDEVSSLIQRALSSFGELRCDVESGRARTSRRKSYGAAVRCIPITVLICQYLVACVQVELTSPAKVQDPTFPPSGERRKAIAKFTSCLLDNQFAGGVSDALHALTALPKRKPLRPRAGEHPV